MKEFNYTITDEIGIHARPAGMLVKEAGNFPAKITITCNGKSADAKRLMALMTLGVKHGDIVTVQVEGEQEEETMAAMEHFFQTNL